MESNPQLELAAHFVRFTNKNIFLTGKAGTGKTTFLHQLKLDSPKRMVVVAPTGVAAINAGGVTIHSFFQLPFGPYLPGAAQDPSRVRKFNREKIAIIKSLDLLVIDEISMVRADLLDGIDDVLRRYKDYSKPFGGVQLLMIGDLHQLPPVVKEEEWNMLRPYYDTMYFFGSRALMQSMPISIELKHIYRQSDRTFIDLLNKVRDNQIDSEVLALLNSRFQEKFEPTEKEPYITLTSHNASAQTINHSKLTDLKGGLVRFTANISGDFPTFAYPTDEVLELKVNAQVMFCKNDVDREKRFYNGKIGKVTKTSPSTIYVRCPGENNDIEVSRVIWNNIKYTLNEETKEVTEEILGSFEHFPLKLAWAITIHKSQGLTFERAIIDANAAFAHGQVYVALSRCKTFEGIVLRSKISNHSIKTDTVVKSYSESMDKNAPDEQRLKSSKIEFQQSLILELFEFTPIKHRFDKMERVFLEHQNTLLEAAIHDFQALFVQTENEIIAIGYKFKPQIQHYFAQAEMPEDNPELQARIQKACLYFIEKLEKLRAEGLTSIRIETDNQSVLKLAFETMDNLQKEVFIKKACFVACKEGFSTQGYLKAKANADIDYLNLKRAAPTPKKEYTDGLPHPKLVAILKHWREDMAAELGLDIYAVLPTKSMLELVEYLPTSKAELKRIKGIGKAKIVHFGEEIIRMIEAYCQQNNIVKTQASFVPKPDAEKPVIEKIDSKKISYELFLAGKSIPEIAAERGFAESTIEGHLCHYLKKGDIHIFALVDRETVEILGEYFMDNPNVPFSEVKAYFDDEYSYGTIKLVEAYMHSLAQDE